MRSHRNNSWFLVLPAAVIGITAGVAPVAAAVALAIPVLILAASSGWSSLLVTGFSTFEAQPLISSPGKVAMSDVLLGCAALGIAVRVAGGLVLTNRRLYGYVAVFIASEVLSLLAAREKVESLIGIAQSIELLLVPALLISVYAQSAQRQLLLLRVTAAGFGVAAVASIADVGVKILGDSDVFSEQARGLGGPFQGYLVGLGLLFTLVLLLERVPLFPSRFGYLALLPVITLFAFALIATQTRGAWIATAVGAVVVFAYHTRTVLIAVPVIGSVLLLGSPILMPYVPQALADRAAAIVNPDPQFNYAAAESNRIRTALAALGLEFWKDSPIIGIGLKNFRSELEAHVGGDVPLAIDMPGQGPVNVDGPHNFYIRVLAEQGTVGIVALALLAGWCARASLRRARSHDTPSRVVGRFSVAAVALVATLGLFFELLGSGTAAFVIVTLVPAATEN